MAPFPSSASGRGGAPAGPRIYNRRAVTDPLAEANPSSSQGGPPDPGSHSSAPAYAEMAPKPPDGAVDLPALVPGEGPLELDVGFGRGLSLFERAAIAPQSRLLGLEVRAKWVCQVDARCRREGLQTVRVLLSDARELLARAGPEGCLSRVFVYFPDPWWKKRHGKRRVVDAAFVAEVARLLAPGGELFVQTDVPERAASYRALMEAEASFARVTAPDHNPFGARSNRERRAAEDGLPVYRLLATKGGSAQ
jgi:tRNA (guanine-N7-)-methyltransferase